MASENWMGGQGKEDALIESFLAVVSTRQGTPVLASCSISEGSGLPRGAGKARGADTPRSHAIWETPFLSPILWSLSGRGEAKNKRRSPPKSEAKRHWTAAWKWNVLIALIKMQRGCKRSEVGDKETTLNGRSFIFRTPKCPEPCPGEFRGARGLLAPLDDLVTYFIVHWSIPRVTGELGAAPDMETVPEVLNSINGTTFPWSFN